MRSLSLLLLATMLTGCAASTVRQYLDNDTAATITVAGGSWVFARERTDLAVNARDYLTLTPVQINRNGQRITYLYCQLWSTIDRRRSKSIVPADATLALIADDRRLVLPKSAGDVRRLGFGHSPVDLPSNATEVRVLSIDSELLRFVLNAAEVRIALTTDESTEYFVSWRDGRHTAIEFLRHIETAQR